MEEFENIIEKYRRELVELSKQNEPLQTAVNSEEESPGFPLSGIGEAAKEADADQRQDDQQSAVQEQTDQPAAAQSAQAPPVMPGIEITAGVPLSNPNREKFATYDEFLQNNPQSGTLKVQVYATDQSYPIDNARVTVFLDLKNGAKEMFSALTNTDGIVDSIVLPAPDKAMSQSPSNSAFLPYAVYTTVIERPGYVNAKYTNVPVFSGIESIQGVEMVPLVANGDGPEMPEMCSENQFQRLEGE
ncbi:MAG: hypothetical protein IJU45_05705 [Clostridia bacterium]|nr:hypothetical protein [Clostridia bacterium]